MNFESFLQKRIGHVDAISPGDSIFQVHCLANKVLEVF